MHHLQRSNNTLIIYNDYFSCYRALYLFGLAKSYHYFQLKCREPIVSKPDSYREDTSRHKYKDEQCGKYAGMKDVNRG